LKLTPLPQQSHTKGKIAGTKARNDCTTLFSLAKFGKNYNENACERGRRKMNLKTQV
jgi:hypothetical protein